MQSRDNSLETESSNPVAAKSDRTQWTIAFIATPIVALLGVFLLLDVFHRDLSIPFEYAHDAFLVTIPIKTVVQEGWWLENPLLGAPMKMEFYDYPSNPSLHLAIIKLMAMFETNAFRLLNYYFLLSFPLIAVCSLAAFKTLRMSVTPSVFLSLIFAFSPYHFWRGESHLWLGCYFTVPLSMIVIAWVLQNRKDLFFNLEDGKLKWKVFALPSCVAVFICATLGFDFPYYPLFAAFLLLIAGPYAAVRTHSWQPVFRAASLICLIAGFFILNIAPNLMYSLQHGKNKSPMLATVRNWNHAEMYGLKIASLLLPAENHPVKKLGRLRDKYEKGTIAPSEGSAPALGTVGAIGFLSLVGWLLFRQNRGKKPEDASVDAMSILNVATLLLATIGGFSALTNLFTGGALRGYNRISIYIMFFSLVPVGFWIAKMHGQLSSRRRLQMAFTAGLVLCAAWSGIEQSRYCRMTGPTELAELENDKKFVNFISQTIGKSSKVFQYPVQNFLSQTGPAIQFDPYSHFRGYLHSDTLTWSFGAVLGRAPAHIQDWIDAQSPREALQTLALMEFGGIYIDRKLYADNGAKMEAALELELGMKPTVSDNGRLSFFPIQSYESRLRSQHSPDTFAAMKDAAQHPVLTEWENADVEEVYPDERFRWVHGKKARLKILNMANTSRRIEVQFGIATATEPRVKARIEGLGMTEELEIGQQPVPVKRTVEVPPGTHYLNFYCDAKPLHTPMRDVTFRICAFQQNTVDVANIASKLEMPETVK